MKLNKYFLTDYLNEFEVENFKIYTYKEVIKTNDLEFALDIFKSDGAFAIGAMQEGFGKFVPEPLLLGYKKAEFPIDIYHLIETRDLILDFGHQALSLLKQDSSSRFFNFYRESWFYEGHFEGFYSFFPELIDKDGIRFTIQNALTELRMYKLNHRLAEYCIICNNIAIQIERYLCQYIDISQICNYKNLDLTKYSKSQFSNETN